MTKRLASPGACLEPGHGHVVLARRRPLEVDDHLGADYWLTLWLCPVKHQLSAVLEDGRPVELSRQAGGPLGLL